MNTHLRILAFVIVLCLPLHATGQDGFFDDFTSGDLEGWRVGPDTSADVSTGDLVISRSGFAELIRDSLTMEDASIRTRVRMQEVGPNSAIGVKLRRQGTLCYYAGVLADGDSFFGKCGGEENVFEIVDTDFNVLDEDVMLQLDAIGNSISFWAWHPNVDRPAAPLSSVLDDTYGSGEVSLWANDAITPSRVEGVFRFVHVETASIPEPSSVALLTMGVFGVIHAQRRATRRK